MKYYSTNGKALDATLEEAVVRGLASDKGLYMPVRLNPCHNRSMTRLRHFLFQK